MTTIKLVKHQPLSSKKKTSTKRKRTLRNTIRSRKRRNQTKRRNGSNKGGSLYNDFYDRIFKLSKEWSPIHHRMPAEGFKISNIIAIGSFRYQNDLKMLHRHKLFCVYKNPDNGNLVLYCKSMPWTKLYIYLLRPLKFITKLFNPFGLLYALGMFYVHLTRNPFMIGAEQTTIISTECGYSTYSTDFVTVEGTNHASMVAQDSSLLLTSGVAGVVEFLIPWLIIGFTANKIVEFAGRQIRAEDIYDVEKIKKTPKDLMMIPAESDKTNKLKVLEYINLVTHETRNLYKKWYAVTKSPKTEMNLSMSSNDDDTFGKIVYGEQYDVKKHGSCKIDWIKRVDSYIKTGPDGKSIIDIKDERNQSRVNIDNNTCTLNGLTTTVEKVKTWSTHTAELNSVKNVVREQEEADKQ